MQRTLIIIFLGFVFGSLTGLGIYTRMKALHLLPEQATPVPNQPSITPTPANLVRSEGDVQLYQNNVKKCRDEGRIPVVGFGIDCVCLYREAVAWGGE
jgi:hypothetical protein